MHEQIAVGHHVESGLEPSAHRPYMTRGDDKNVSSASRILLEAGSRVIVRESSEHAYETRQSTNSLAAVASQRTLATRAVNFDVLTGLPNRHAVQQLLAFLMDDLNSGTGSQQYVVLSLNIDAFNVINDSLGHEAGDVLLLAIATRLQDVLGGGALVARHGGGEFIIVSAGTHDLHDAATLAKGILHAFDAPFSVNGQSVFSSASIGVVFDQGRYTSPIDVLRDAGIAMYRAKRLGKSSFVVFDKAMHEAAQERFTLGNDLRRALERHEFRTHFQPIVDLASRRIIGCEALVRWQHPERGLLLPSEFLDVAEEIGIISRLDWWMLEETCKCLHEWRKRFGSSGGLVANINLDERQLKAPGFVQQLDEVVRANEIDPQNIALEVTETIFRSGRGELQETLANLKCVGVKLVVDDFGTGYSSLDSFAASPFDALKIDRSFVQDLESNARHRAIVRTISGFANDLGLGLTAEGVESFGQANLLLDLGCTTAQGFLYSHPLNQEKMGALLERRLV